MAAIDVGGQSSPGGSLAVAARPLRVLLVEDDDGDAQIVRLLLEESSAAIALTHVVTLKQAMALAEDFDCALLDLNLPDATGLDGLQRLRAAAHNLAILVLTGQTDEAIGTAALAAGAQDYLIKGNVDGELLARSVRYAVERRRADDAQRELTLARLQEAETARLERGLLPTPLIGDAAPLIAAHYRAGRRKALLGGDFYDVVQDSNDCLHAIIGDVSGHGPDEAAVGVCLRVAWRTLILSDTATENILPTLQAVLDAERHHRSVFATVATIALEPDRSSVTLRTAGHPAPLLLPPDGDPMPLAEGVGGPPLGVVDQVAWAATRVSLHAGAGVLLFTDGIVEGRTPAGERLGEAGLAALVVQARAAHPDDGAAALRQLVEQAEALNAGPLRDDVALVLVST
jgi:serine phosphatase RsbU (regulator of sigma subunit)